MSNCRLLRLMVCLGALLLAQPLQASWVPQGATAEQHFEWLMQQLEQATNRQEKRLAYRLAAALWQQQPQACGDDAKTFFDDYLSFLLSVEKISNQQEIDEALDTWHQRREQQLGEALGRECLPPSLPFSRRVKKLSADVAVLHIILLPDHIELILAKAQRRIRYRVPVPAQRVEALAKRFTVALKSAQPRAQRYGQLLKQWMIQPLASELADPTLRVLQLQLDHRLLALPWAAIPFGSSGQSQTLGGALPIVIGSGPEMISDAQPQTGEKLLFGALSDAQLNAHFGFSALPGVRQEWQQIRPLLSGKALFNQRFTSKRISQALDASDYSILHLASHGELGQAADSYVLLGDGPLRLEDLGSLVRSRRFSLQPLRLVTLSTCDSAVNFSDQEDARRARLGLAGVALQAGAQNALASLWPVDDRASSRFMTAFYGALAPAQGSQTVAQALQVARRELQAQGMAAQDWAAFQLYGSGR